MVVGKAEKKVGAAKPGRNIVKKGLFFKLGKNVLENPRKSAVKSNDNITKIDIAVEKRKIVYADFTLNIIFRDFSGRFYLK